MRTPARLFVVLAWIVVLSGAPLTGLFAQEVDSPDRPEGLEIAYVQVYFNFDQVLAEEPSDFTMIFTGVYDMESEEDAENALEDFIESLHEEYDDVSVEKIDDIGDEARQIWYADEGLTIHIVAAQSDDAFIVSLAMNPPDEFEVPTQIVDFVLEEGPSDEEPKVDDEGIITGGWAEAFPQPGDIDALNDLDPAPVFEEPWDQE